MTPLPGGQDGERHDARRTPRLWVERLSLTDFRNYAALTLELGPEPVVLVGANGSGKTNILEAVSLLAPGQGLRQAPFPDLARNGGDGGWSVAARVHTTLGAVDIGTGLAAGAGQCQTAPAASCASTARRKSGSGALADYVEMVWVTPAMDGLFTGPAPSAAAFSIASSCASITGHRTRAGTSSAPWRSAIACSRTVSREARGSTASRSSWLRRASPSPPRAPRPWPHSPP